MRACLLKVVTTWDVQERTHFFTWLEALFSELSGEGEFILAESTVEEQQWPRQGQTVSLEASLVSTISQNCRLRFRVRADGSDFLTGTLALFSIDEKGEPVAMLDSMRSFVDALPTSFPA